MKPRKVIIISIIAVLLISLTGYIMSEGKVPKGWLLSGSNSGNYEVGIDKKSREKGENVIYLKSVKENITGFGTLMQSFSADNYLSKRARFSGYVKSKDVIGVAGLWMRIDGKEDPTKPLAFDNMGNRPIVGTTEWTKYDVVLDIPSNSNMINFGILLSSSGEVWVKNLKFEAVDKTVPSTDMINKSSKLTEPVNLDFGN
ncbi:MAG: hypothetical protein WCA84_04250 [Ignavibacteriaceae bacterium]